MTRRGWWLVVLNFLLPGSAQVARRAIGELGADRPRRDARAVGAGRRSASCARCCGSRVFAHARDRTGSRSLRRRRACSSPTPCCGSSSRSTPCAWSGWSRPAARRASAIADHRRRADWSLVERQRGLRRATSPARRATRSARSSGRAARPCRPPTATTTSCCSAPTAAPAATRCGSTASRWCRSTPTTGATTITGIPRDMPNFPFSAGPMQDRTRTATRVTPTRTAAGGAASTSCAPRSRSARTATRCIPMPWRTAPSPGIEATKDAAEGILGIEIPYYVFIDMHGFAALVDALGGVDITVDRAPAQGRRTGLRRPARRRLGDRLDRGRARSTWTATPRSGTPARGTPRATSTA